MNCFSKCFSALCVQLYDSGVGFFAGFCSAFVFWKFFTRRDHACFRFALSDAGGFLIGHSAYDKIRRRKRTACLCRSIFDFDSFGNSIFFIRTKRVVAATDVFAFVGRCGNDFFLRCFNKNLPKKRILKGKNFCLFLFDKISNFYIINSIL